MTNIPVAGLYTQLSLDPAQMDAGIQAAGRALGSLRAQLKATQAGATQAGLGIDTGLNKGLKAAGGSVKVLGTELGKLTGKADPLAKAMARLEREQAKLDRAFKMGRLSADELETAMAKLKSGGLGAAAVEMDRLKAKFDPIYAASKRYEAQVSELDRALKLGALTSAQYDAAMERLNTELATGATGFSRAAAQADRFNATAGTMSHQTGNIAAQFQDIGVQLAGGQSPFLIALQQGTQLTGAFGQMEGGVRGVAKGLGAAFMSLVSPLSLITIGAIAAGGALVQWAMSAGQATDDATRMADAISAVEGQMSKVEGAARNVETATRDYNEALAASKVLQSGGAEYLSVLSAELNARKEILAVEQARLEINRLTLQQSIAASKAQIDALFAEVRLAQETYLAANAGRLTEQEIAQIKLEQLGVIRDIINANQSLFLGQREQEANLALINTILDSNTSEVQAQKDALTTAANEASRLAATSPGPGWMGAAITETNALISRLIAARQQRDGLLMSASSANYDTALANTGQSSGPDAARTKTQWQGGAFAAPVRAAGLAYTPPARSSGGSSGRSAPDEFARDVERLNKAATEGTTPLARYQAELAKLDALKGKGLSEAAYSQEVTRLNEELANSIPMVGDVADAFGAFVASGFRDFKGFAQSIVGSFQKMLADMVATAARNKIMLSLGIGGGGMAGTAANAATGGLLSGGLGSMLFSGGTGSMGLPAFGGILGGLGAAVPILGGIGLIAGLLGGARRRRRQQQAQAEAQAAAAAQDAATAEFNQMRGLEARYFEAEGNITELRRRELEAIAPANKALQERIWALEDEVRISNERKGLEEQLLQLQGNEAELRRRALEALAPANRALQEQIWATEDAAEATDRLRDALSNLTEEDFASALDFNRARGSLSSGLTSSAPAAAQVALSQAVAASPAGAVSDAMLANINSNIALLWKTVQSWDFNGTPPVRA